MTPRHSFESCIGIGWNKHLIENYFNIATDSVVLIKLKKVRRGAVVVLKITGWGPGPLFLTWINFNSSMDK